MATQRSRRSRQADQEPEATSEDEFTVRVTDLHRTHAKYIEQETGLKVDPEHIAVVYKTRVAFRQSEMYEDYLDSKGGDEPEPAEPPARGRRRSAEKEAPADEVSARRSRRQRSAPAAPADEPAATPSRRSRRAAQSEPDAEAAPAATSRRRRGSAAATDSGDEAQAAPARSRRRRAASADDEAPF